jgi:hypothetical protein
MSKLSPITVIASFFALAMLLSSVVVEAAPAEPGSSPEGWVGVSGSPGPAQIDPNACPNGNCAPPIRITKEFADPTATINPGDDVEFLIIVTKPLVTEADGFGSNTAAAANAAEFATVEVTDTLTPDCDRANLGPLATGESTSYNCTASNVTSDFVNEACVFAQTAEGQPFHTDPSEDCDQLEVVISPSPIEGRITGGGNVFMEDGSKVTRGLELHCDRRAPNNLEVNFHASGDKFHLDNQAELLFAECLDFPELLQDPPPGTPFDTFIGKGMGKYNNETGAVACFVLVDDGEPGTTDMMAVQVFFPVADPSTITCQTKNLGVPFPGGGTQFQLLEPSGSPQVQYVSGVLKNGNLQAHKDNK